jgi:hypothetical protein
MEIISFSVFAVSSLIFGIFMGKKLGRYLNLDLEI